MKYWESRAQLIYKYLQIHCKNMKILIQDSKTEKFVRLDSLWTANLNMAFDFLSASKAIYFGLKRLKHSFRVVEIETNNISGVRVPVSYRFSREYIPWLMSSQLQIPEPSPSHSVKRKPAMHASESIPGLQMMGIA